MLNEAERVVIRDRTCYMWQNTLHEVCFLIGDRTCYTWQIVLLYGAEHVTRGRMYFFSLKYEVTWQIVLLYEAEHVTISRFF
jgi:hypothetical protein